MAGPADTSESETPRSPVERFGDIAIETGLLTQQQVDALLAQQQQYKDMGIPMRLDSIAVDTGILTRADGNIILNELRKRRRLTQGPARKPVPFESEDDLIVPCALGPFEIEERLGGVMGAVYRAYDTKNQRTVALKLLPRGLSHDRNLVERFQREARAAGKLKHPNVVQFYEAGEIAKRYYISMEFVDGEALTDRLERQGRMTEQQSLNIVRELAHALYHVHVNGLLHRDVKPDNVIMDRAGRVRLADLGLAKVLTENTRLTESGIAIGTPHYISPEQARGDKVIDRRADLYGVGATLFHLVCGRPIFDGNAAEVMRKHVFVAPPDPKTYALELSESTRKLILKLQAKDPNQRVQSADALIALINTTLNDRHTQVTAESVRIVSLEDLNAAPRSLREDAPTGTAPPVAKGDRAAELDGIDLDEPEDLADSATTRDHADEPLPGLE